MFLVLIVLPICAAIFAGFFGRLFGAKGSCILTVSLTMVSSIFSWIILYEVGLNACPCYIEFYPWIISEFLDSSWGFIFDSLSVLMSCIITTVSTCVLIYSASYMEHDPFLSRFMSYITFFIFGMLILVTSNNLLQLFVGWELIGVASFLLINFWFTRIQANKSAIQAFIINRTGDVGLALGIIGLFSLTRSVNFEVIFACCSDFYNTNFYLCGIQFDAITTCCIFLLIGATGKSAQLGLHIWLPNAMEAPTPISALLHAATLVTAGIFLIARCSPIFEQAPFALICTAFLGGITALFAATTGIVQNDVKRVIAYSTCSQLGFMIFACGLSHYNVGIFHMANHAFFKALLFLTAGALIHSFSDEQDMRRYGGAIRLLPMTLVFFEIGSLALIGFPSFSGFYSKDVILELAYGNYSINGEFIYWCGIFATLGTAYYSFRLLFLSFGGKTRAFKSTIVNIHEAPQLMTIPLIILSIGSIFFGYFMKDLMIGTGTDFWNNAIFIQPKNSILLESEYIPQGTKFIPIFFGMIGGILAYIFNICETNISYFLKISSIGREFYTFFNKRWLFDRIYNAFIGLPSLNFGYTISFKLLDKGLFEWIGPSGIIREFPRIATKLAILQSGFLFHYAFTFLIGVSVLVSLYSISDCDSRTFIIFFILLIFS
jgi:proton-translocating NADH-quinone oxidoreductase chain L